MGGVENKTSDEPKTYHNSSYLHFKPHLFLMNMLSIGYVVRYGIGIQKTGIMVSVIVLKEFYLSIQEAVEDGHHKALRRHRGPKHETKTLTHRL